MSLLDNLHKSSLHSRQRSTTFINGFNIDTKYWTHLRATAHGKEYTTKLHKKDKRLEGDPGHRAIGRARSIWDWDNSTSAWNPRASGGAKPKYPPQPQAQQHENYIRDDTYPKSHDRHIQNLLSDIIRNTIHPFTSIAFRASNRENHRSKVSAPIPVGIDLRPEVRPDALKTIGMRVRAGETEAKGEASGRVG